MSSGFVSAGTNQEPVERDDEWHRVQQELEEERRRKAELGKQDGGKSLYEVLQQNKMAKQEAFEEKIKLKNQFRALDEDEIDFLDSIMESTRAQEAVVKKETAEQLELFRRQREEAEKAHLEDTSADVPPTAEGEDWKIHARKRRREKNKDLLIPGRKRKSMGEATADSPTAELSANKKARELVETKHGQDSNASASDGKDRETIYSTSTENSTKDAKVGSPAASQKEPAAKPPVSSLGLAGYSSESE